MALQTDLSRSPYFDDYDPNKNFYRILYRPSVAVQTRELNQMQTILQDQIDKFGSHIFTEGSVVDGCSFTFDQNYTYVKINDNYANGSAFTISDFSNNYVYNSNGLKALIVDTIAGFESQDPDLNTLYIKYINTGTFTNGAQQTAFANADVLTVATSANISIGNVTVATVANSTGSGYAFTTSTGTIFQKGFFVTVQPQTMVIDKYSNSPNNISVGFNTIENIITPEADTSLLDNAAGAPNYSAPGAHRLQLVPTLITRQTDQIANNESFFSLVDFQAGVPVTIRNTAQYNILNKQLAQTTYETNGNFVVNPFILSTAPKNPTDPLAANNVNLVTSRGIGYVEGYRVEFINNNTINLRKGLDTEQFQGQIVSANYGTYVYVQEYCGDFDSEDIVQVELHNIAKTAVSTLAFTGVGYSSTTKIGTAYIKSVAYDSGQIGTNTAQYRLYLFNITMNAGQNFSNVKSIINHNGSSVKAVADLVLTYNATANANIAALQDQSLNTMIFPYGQKAIVANGFNNIEYVYRNRTSAQFATSGTMAVTLPSVTGTGTETFTYNGLLSSNETDNMIVIPLSTVKSTNKTGTVSASSGSPNVSGSSTTFTTNYKVGDFISINSEQHTIAFIGNNTFLQTKENFSSSPSSNTHAKEFPVGVPIDFSQSQRSVNISGSTATFNIGEQLATTLQTNVYYDINRKETVAIKKNITKQAYIKIDCSNNAANSVGPWCLGLPDIFKLNAVYIGSGGSYSNSGADVSSMFTLTNGQGDSLYDLGYLNLTTMNSGLLSNTSTLLVDVDVFSYDQSQGVGFFTANSYPIDDVNTSNTNAITTQQIPQYTSTSGTTYDLRDCVDFRPFVANTAAITQSVSSATINPSNASVISILSAGSYLPSPDSNWQADVSHYLPRKDLAVITTQNQFKVIEGTSAVNPRTPPDQPGTMTLGVITVPPYPSLSTPEAKAAKRYDYAITISSAQNRRYTMADIGKLATRIDNLEYYTSLNLLEQNTNNLLVKNDTTGLNRFKNGILVDPFNGFDISNTLDPNFNIAIDPVKKELRPYFYQRVEQFALNTDLSSNNISQYGSAIMLKFDEVPYIQQPYASQYRNCVDGNIFVWQGTIALNPSYQTTPDLKTNPDVVNNLDLSQNFINLQKAWGTQWGNWTTVASTTATSVGATTQTGTTTDQYGNIVTNYNQQVTTTTTQQQTQTGTTLAVTGQNDQTFNLGTFVQSINIQPYISSNKILFTASGLRPGARVYAYFNNVAVNDWVYPTDNTFAQTSTTKFGDPLIVTNDGHVYGSFTIPPNTFQATQLVFMLCDVDNLTTGSNAITTQASGTYYATNLSVAQASSTLNVKQPILSVQEVVQTQNVTTTNNGSNNFNIITPAPPKPPAIVNPSPPPWLPQSDGTGYTYGGGGDGGGGSYGDCGYDGGCDCGDTTDCADSDEG